eukprot:Selendium_serpulae@DN4159_c0_g1_i2.p1
MVKQMARQEVDTANTGLSFEQVHDVLSVLHSGSDPLDTLQIPENQMRRLVSGRVEFDETVCKKAYRTMQLKVHPDKNQHPLAHEAFVRVNNAWTTLISRIRAINSSMSSVPQMPSAMPPCMRRTRKK